MKKQFNNDLININNLEKGKTGNADLDKAFAEMNSSPLILVSEEVGYIVDNAMVSDVTASVIKNTIILGGAVLASAIFGWMYFQYNSHQKAISYPKKAQVKKMIPFEQNKIKLSSSNGNSNVSSEENYIITESNNKVNSNSIITSTKSTNQTLVREVNSNIISDNSTKKTNAAKTLSKTEDQSNQHLAEDSKKSNSNFSKTIITQRYFDDGSAKMTLDYKNQPVRITINSRGIESLFINSEEVAPAYYYLYDDLASEAFKRAKIEPLALPTNDANAKPNISAMMTGALVRRALITNGEEFSFELTSSTAILNNTHLNSDIKKDLLQVYQNAFGSSLPRGGKFIIGKQK